LKSGLVNPLLELPDRPPEFPPGIVTHPYIGGWATMLIACELLLQPGDAQCRKYYGAFLIDT